LKALKIRAFFFSYPLLLAVYPFYIAAYGDKLPLEIIKDMITILQVERDDLEEIIRECVREAIIATQPPKQEPIQDRITIKEVKQMTGNDESWIYKHTMKTSPDPLPYEKFGKRLYFSRRRIQDYIDRHTKSVPGYEKIITESLAKAARKRLVK
jgi:hypothetical protein